MPLDNSGVCPQTWAHGVFVHRQAHIWSLPTDVAPHGLGLQLWKPPPSRPQESPGTGQGLERPHTVRPRGLHADGEGTPHRTHGNRVALPTPQHRPLSCGSRGRGLGLPTTRGRLRCSPAGVCRSVRHGEWQFLAELGRKEAPGPQKVPCRPGRTEGSARQAPEGSAGGQGPCAALRSREEKPGTQAPCPCLVSCS